MTTRIALFCLLGGLSSAIAVLGAGHFVWWWLSGVVLAAAFVPVARFGPQKPLVQFGAILLTLVIVGTVCTLSEAVIFFPTQVPHVGRDLAGGLLTDLVAAVILTLLIKLLKLNQPSDMIVKLRPAGTAALMVALCGVAYVLYYMVFGGITYAYFTRQYYPDAQKLVANFGMWFWVIEWARGALMTLAVLPIIHTLRMRRWQAAVAVGLVLWVVGGAAPLLVPNALMVPDQRYIHIVEIFTQNALLGFTAVLLLRPKVPEAARKLSESPA